MESTISTELKKTIKEKLLSVKNKEELVALFNEVAQCEYQTTESPFKLKYFTYYANPDISKKRYQTFKVKKKSGKERIINSPSSGLKLILRCFKIIIEYLYTPNNSVMGFTEGKSVADNARLHLNQYYVYNIDLSDFFHSFDRNRVKMGLWRYLFDMQKEQEELAFFLAALCTHPIEVNGKMKTVLPQGSPVSPILTNILCQNLDRRLRGFAKRFGVIYSRYADDITFSGNRNVFRDIEFQKELKRIIEEDQKLKINPEKTRLQKDGYRKEVTGVLVNKNLNVHRKYVKQIRMWIFYIEKYGMEKAEQLFRQDYIKDKGDIKFSNNPMLNVITGKLQYMKMVKGEEDSTYKKLMERFKKVSGRSNDIDKLLTIWETEGVSNAINFYEQLNKNG